MTNILRFNIPFKVDNLKRALQRLILLAFGLLVGLIIAEIGARFFYTVPEGGFNVIKVGTPPPYIHYVDAMPWAYSVTSYKVEGEYETTVSINEKGLRGPEVPYEKPPGEFRILYVGDSYVQAVQVEFEDTVYQQLGTLLEDLPGQYEVVGVGQAGWGTDQAYLYYLHEGRRYQPDLVVYQFITNDVTDNARDTFNPSAKFRQHFSFEGKKLVRRDFDINSRHNYQNLVSIHRHLYLFSRLYALTLDIWRGDVELFRQAQPVYTQLDVRPTLEGNRMLFIYQEPTSDDFRQAWELTEGILSEWNDQVRKDGAMFAVVYVPDHWTIYNWSEIPTIYPELTTEFGNWNRNKPDEHLSDITQRHNIPFLSLTTASQAFVTENEQPLYGRKDVHWTKAGHAVGAQTIFKWLLEQDWFQYKDAQ